MRTRCHSGMKEEVEILFLRSRFLVISLLFVLAAGCTAKPGGFPSPEPGRPRRDLSRIGYAIQVGAFSNLDNAVRLSQSLENRGLDAYYFVHETGLYKVRFGNFPSKTAARRSAEDLLAKEIIEDFYIVGPEDYPKPSDRRKAQTHLRNEIVRTANRFTGVPYRWGGTSSKHGFDCSGLSMVVYRLNGLNLPRSANGQWAVGSPVRRSHLSKADLVFFATRGRRKVSHVGIYVGGGNFIHAPGRGKRIRLDSLSNRYFRRRYVGGRTYL